MPVVDLSSGDLWNEITKMLDAKDEHVCVLPMTTFIKPVRSVTVLQTDTQVNAAYSPCPPELKDYKPQVEESQEQPQDQEQPQEQEQPQDT